MAQKEQELQEQLGQVSSLRSKLASLESEIEITKAGLDNKDKASSNAMVM